jgi:hypothetical protein
MSVSRVTVVVLVCNKKTMIIMPYRNITLRGKMHASGMLANRLYVTE